MIARSGWAFGEFGERGADVPGDECAQRFAAVSAGAGGCRTEEFPEAVIDPNVAKGSPWWRHVIECTHTWVLRSSVA